MLGLIGTKLGMTQVFDETGNVIPVTLIKVEKNYVVGERSEAKNGYCAVVLGSVPLKETRTSKPFAGQFTEGLTPLKHLREFRNFDKECKIGDELEVGIFDSVSYVDVVGISKGKGYQGDRKSVV